MTVNFILLVDKSFNESPTEQVTELNSLPEADYSGRLCLFPCLMVSTVIKGVSAAVLKTYRLYLCNRETFWCCG